jgi:starch synthase
MCQISDVVDGLMSIGLEIIVVLHDEEKALSCINPVVEAYQGRIKVIPETAENIIKALSASDLYLAPGKSRPHYIGQILALKYGVVPVMHHSENLDGLLSDYDPRNETGEAFLFNFHTHWSFFAAVVRALENYKLSYDWNTIVKNGMNVEL